MVVRFKIFIFILLICMINVVSATITDSDITHLWYHNMTDEIGRSDGTEFGTIVNNTPEGIYLGTINSGFTFPTINTDKKNMAVSICHNISSYAGTWIMLLGIESGGGFQGYDIGNDRMDGPFGRLYSAGLPTLTSGTYLYTLTTDDNYVYYYINGTFKGRADIKADNFTFNRFSDVYNTGVYGNVGFFKIGIYNRNLTPTEINNLWDNGACTSPKEAQDVIPPNPDFFNSTSPGINNTAWNTGGQVGVYGDSTSSGIIHVNEVCNVSLNTSTNNTWTQITTTDTQNHSFTIPSSHALISGVNTINFNFTDSSGNSNTSGPLSLYLSTIPTNQSIKVYNHYNHSITQTNGTIGANLNVSSNVTFIVNSVSYHNSTITKNISYTLTGLTANTQYFWNFTAYAGDNQSTTVFNGTFSFTTLNITTNQSIMNYTPRNISITNESFIIEYDTNITSNVSCLVSSVVYTNHTFSLNHSIYIGSLSEDTMYYWNCTAYAEDNPNTTVTTNDYEVKTLAAPVVNSSRISPVVAYTNDTLLGYCNVTDGDGDNITYKWRWYLNNELYSRTSADYYCYQESVNVSTGCGGLDNGNSWEDGTGTWYHYEEIYDESWSEFSLGYVIGVDTRQRYETYSVPINANGGTLIRFKYGEQPGIDINVLVHSTCWSYAESTDNLTIQMRSIGATSGIDLLCRNGSSTYISIFSNITEGNKLYESGIYWGMSYEDIQGVETNVDNISSSETTRDENWTLSCNGNDGILNSLWLNSSTLTISNSITTNSSRLYSLRNSTVDTIFGYCNVTDIDDDNITYLWRWYLNNELHSYDYNLQSDWCYQENSTGRTSCDTYNEGYINYSGSVGDGWLNELYLIDSNWDSAAEATGTYGIFIVNYTKPTNVQNNSLYTYKYRAYNPGNGTMVFGPFNKSIPSGCWYGQGGNVVFKFLFNVTLDYTNTFNLSCLDDSNNWITIDYNHTHSPDRIYEEAMWWNITKHNVSPGVEINIINKTSGLIVGQNWSLGCRGYDGTNYSNWINSSVLTIVNIVPVVEELNFSPTSVNNTQAMHLNVTCSDSENLSLIAYWQVFNNSNDLIFSGSTIVSNNTNTKLITIGAGNFSVTTNETWHANATCYDGRDNSTWKQIEQEVIDLPCINQISLYGNLTFNIDSWYEKNLRPDGQSYTTTLINATWNYPIVGRTLNITLKLNQTYPTGITLGFDDDPAVRGSINLTTSYQVVDALTFTSYHSSLWAWLHINYPSVGNYTREVEVSCVFT